MQTPFSSKDRIEDLKQTLYSRTRQPHHGRDHQLYEVGHAVQGNWNDPQAPVQKAGKPKKRWNMFTVFLMIALVFFIGAASFAAIAFFRQGNNVTPSNLSISVLGPVAIGGGEPLVLDIAVANNNTTDLELVDLVIEYPEGTKSVNLRDPITITRTYLGDIPSGGVAKHKAEAVLFGAENSTQEILVRVEYRIPSSNAVFEKEVQYSLALNSSPVSLVVKNLNEIVPGQTVQFDVDVTSNSNADITNMLLVGEYPFGFTYKSASPAPAFQNSIWKIDTLKPGETKTITLTGTLDGQNGEKRVFKFNAGIQDAAAETRIAAVFAGDVKEISLERPFLSAQLVFPNDAGEFVVAAPNQRISGQLVVSNTLSTAIDDVRVALKLSGIIIDERSIQANEGFYRSAEDTIIWDSSTRDFFKTFGPGERASLDFTFSTIPLVSESQLVKNPEVSLVAAVSGRRISESNVPETLQDTFQKKVRISTIAEVEAALNHREGPFSNSGPIPPKVENETTYTVTWKLSNTANSLSGGAVTATLPQYVRWVNEISPSSEVVSYDPVKRTVTWNPGEIAAGTGYDSDAKEVSFKIAFFPSATQADTSPVLVSAPSFRYTDRFTSETKTVQGLSLTTGFSDFEEGAGYNDHIVTE